MNSRNNPYDINICEPNGTHFQEVNMLTATGEVVTKLHCMLKATKQLFNI